MGKLLMRSLVVVATIFWNSCIARPNFISNSVSQDEIILGNDEHSLVRRWAPLILLAPGERFMPSSVPYFLEQTIPADPTNRTTWTKELPFGMTSEKYYLFSRKPVEKLLKNSSSFLFGEDPQQSAVPVYAVIKRCTSTKYTPWYTNTINDAASEQNFHVTYWFFYPFNEGKSLCTVSLGSFGPFPVPKLFNKCIGVQKYIGNHVGDWEHMSLYFKNSEIPHTMYVSTHDAGVYYKYDSFLQNFVYDRQETRKGGILHKPKFPNEVNLFLGRPVLYSAKGSHGLWSEPGKHQYLTVPRLYDETGNGIPWKTWESVEIIDPPYTNIPNWLKYRGRWGNTKSYCHPLKKVGINFCVLSDGPTGIPLKRLNFKCPKIK